MAAVKAAAGERHEGAKLRARFELVLGTALEQAVVGSVGAAILQSMPGVGRVLALAAGAILVMRGEWTLGSLLAFQAYLSDVFGPAQYLSSVTLQFQAARASLERMGSVLDRAPEGRCDDGAAAVALGGELELRDVSFAYPDAPPILNGISLHILPGESVALVGPSGAGKTTLAGLVLGFYRPSSGGILFDGRPIESCDIGALRRRLGYVPQRPILSSGSILDNLRFGNPAASIAEVTGAARAAALHADILRMPLDYRTQVGEGGLMLSEGQRQRVALVRALLMNPDVLILDEPTSALDAAAERALIGGIQEWRRGRTMVVITHRMSTAACCDRVVRLDRGGMAEIEPAGDSRGPPHRNGWGAFVQTLDYASWTMRLKRQVGDRRVPLGGTLELTHRCNNRCRHCFNNLRSDDAPALGRELSTREVARILDEAAALGCVWVLLTGGEILLRPDFTDIYDHARGLGLLVTLFTNGTLVTPELADHLDRHRPFSVEVTLYGATRETYERVTGDPGIV